MGPMAPMGRPMAPMGQMGGQMAPMGMQPMRRLARCWVLDGEIQNVVVKFEKCTSLLSRQKLEFLNLI